MSGLNCEHAGHETAGGDEGPSRQEFLLPSEIGGVRIPDSDLAKVVTSLVREVSSAPLFNHVARSFLFGSRLGTAKALKFDPELLFVAAMMHDLGLTEQYMAEARFEIDGADAAARILRARGYPEAKIDIVWEAIALHASMEIAARRCSEVALLHLGTFMDAGFNAEKLPAAVFQEVFDALPRMNSSTHMIEAIGAVLRKKPHTAYLTFEKDIGERTVPGFSLPNFCDLKAPHPFNG
jgi:hypothetical protein